MLDFPKDTSHTYVIVTAAHNEADSIERTIKCVLAQTARPLKWVIVSDGSTDRTDDIVKSYAARYPWIVYLRREKTEEESQRVERISPGKVRAIDLAMESVLQEHWQFLANLDADVSFEPSYYERVLAKFDEDRKLGLAGGFVDSVLPDGTMTGGGFRNPHAVGGPIQMFRRECWEQIGGYKPYGHEDCIACNEANQAGWTVRSFREISALHHVPILGYAVSVRSKVPTCFYLGKMYYVSNTPLWFTCLVSIARCLKKPYLLAGIAMGAGHVCAMVGRKKRIPRSRGRMATHWSHLNLIIDKIHRLLRPGL
jgi:cellulose synthase/poly-beta-1,6-N-acetylglucosamine synthase-like glycosyltransferase